MSATKPLPDPDAPSIVSLRAYDSNGSRVYLVESRSGSLAARSIVYHLVTAHESRLRCGCPAATYGRECRHTRAVRDLLCREAEASRARAEALRQRQPHEFAPPARNTAGFSMWK
jgi:hypothetical protein